MNGATGPGQTRRCCCLLTARPRVARRHLISLIASPRHAAGPPYAPTMRHRLPRGRVPSSARPPLPLSLSLRTSACASLRLAPPRRRPATRAAAPRLSLAAISIIRAGALSLEERPPPPPCCCCCRMPPPLTPVPPRPPLPTPGTPPPLPPRRRRRGLWARGARPGADACVPRALTGGARGRRGAWPRRARGRP